MEMRTRRITAFIIVLTTLFSVASWGAVEAGSSYFTKVNFWYENPLKMPSTNYHVGSILPIGTKVDVLKITDKLIVFRDQKGIVYNIQYIAKYSGPSQKDYLDACFSKEDVLKSKIYKNLSKEEKANITAGTIAEGMSKTAVLMAYGNPPTHKTPSTEKSPWTYWQNRFRTMVVTFGAEDTVTLIKR